MKNTKWLNHSTKEVYELLSFTSTFSGTWIDFDKIGSVSGVGNLVEWKEYPYLCYFSSSDEYDDQIMMEDIENHSPSLELIDYLKNKENL